MWEYPASEGYPGVIETSDTHVYIWDDGTLGEGVLYAIHPDTGEVDWRIENNSHSVGTKAVPEHGQTYIVTDNAIRAIDERTGTEQWDIELTTITETLPANGLPERRESPDNLDFCGARLVDDRLLILFNEGIAAIERDGGLAWWHIFPHQSPDPNGVCNYDTTLWISTEIGDIYGVDVTNGEEIARYESASPISEPRLMNDNLIVTLKTHEHQHFDGHKQRVENTGEFLQLDI